MIEKFCRDVPTILFDSNLDDIGEAFVGSDNPSFVSQSIDYLVRSGEPPVFFEMEAPVNPNARKRRAAYISKMDDLGLEPHPVTKVALRLGRGQSAIFGSRAMMIIRSHATQVRRSQPLRMTTTLCRTDPSKCCSI